MVCTCVFSLCIQYSMKYTSTLGKFKATHKILVVENWSKLVSLTGLGRHIKQTNKHTMKFSFDN